MKTLTTLTTLGAIAALSLSGCAKDPSKDVPAAKVKEATKPAAAKPEAAKPEAAKPAPDPGAEAKAAKAAAAKVAPEAPAGGAGAVALTGDIIYIGSKVTGSHENKFTKWTGSFTPKDGKVAGGSLKFEVDMASTVADFKAPTAWSKKLEEHLKSPDFFNVAAHPKSTFVSKEIKAGAPAGKGTHTVTGTLTIRGTAKDVTFPATIKLDNGKVDASTEFSINRKDFGLVYKGKPDDLIRDGVVLKIHFKG